MSRGALLTLICILLIRCLTDIDDMVNKGTDTLELHKIFSWSSDGLSFKIHHRQKFVDVIMPTFFPRIKYASFTRQLALYGFEKCGGFGMSRGGKLAQLTPPNSP